jgi:cation diffusion facilitator CzcD-associated flavoprotein CzcO
VTTPARFDAIVIGAGFSGLYALHRCDEIAAAGYTGFKLA